MFKRTLTTRLVFFITIFFLVVPQRSLLWAAANPPQSTPTTGKTSKKEAEPIWVKCVSLLIPVSLTLLYLGHYFYRDHYVLIPQNEVAQSAYHKRELEGIDLNGLGYSYHGASYQFEVYLKETLSGRQHFRWLSFLPESEHDQWPEQRFNELASLVQPYDRVRVKPISESSTPDKQYPERIFVRTVNYDITVNARTVVSITVDFHELYRRRMIMFPLGSLGFPLPFSEGEVKEGRALITKVEIKAQ